MAGTFALDELVRRRVTPGRRSFFRATGLSRAPSRPAELSVCSPATRPPRWPSWERSTGSARNGRRPPASSFATATRAPSIPTSPRQDHRRHPRGAARSRVPGMEARHRYRQLEPHDRPRHHHRRRAEPPLGRPGERGEVTADGAVAVRQTVGVGDEIVTVGTIARSRPEPAASRMATAWS